MGNILNPYSILSEEVINVVNYADFNGYTLPSNIYLLDILIQELKKSNIWQKLDVFYIFCGNGSEGFKLINLINPNIHYAFPFGTITWSLDGVLGNGTDGYIDIYNPSTSGINYTLNNACIFGVIVTNNAAPFAFTSATGLEINQLANYSGNAIKINAGNANLSSSVDLSGNGFKSISRMNSSQVELVSKDTTFTRNQNSTVIFNAIQKILRRGNASTTHLISCFGMGAAITYSDTQTFRILYNRFLGQQNLTQVA